LDLLREGIQNADQPQPWFPITPLSYQQDSPSFLLTALTAWITQENITTEPKLYAHTSTLTKPWMTHVSAFRRTYVQNCGRYIDMHAYDGAHRRVFSVTPMSLARTTVPDPQVDPEELIVLDPAKSNSCVDQLLDYWFQLKIDRDSTDLIQVLALDNHFAVLFTQGLNLYVIDSAQPKAIELDRNSFLDIIRPKFDLLKTRLQSFCARLTLKYRAPSIQQKHRDCALHAGLHLIQFMSGQPMDNRCLLSPAASHNLLSLMYHAALSVHQELP
jgi:hypothetical protein